MAIITDMRLKLFEMKSKMKNHDRFGNYHQNFQIRSGNKSDLEITTEAN